MSEAATDDDLPERLEQSVKAARKAGDIPALLALANAAVATLDTIASPAAWNTARRIAYNAAADAWPGWDREPPPRTEAELQSARSLAMMSGRMTERLGRDPMQMGNAAWLTAALDLALGDRQSAIAGFREAEALFSQAPEMTLLAAGYRAIAGDAEAPALETTCTALAASGHPHAGDLREQLLVAQDVFGGS
jgi:hypothetical protein